MHTTRKPPLAIGSAEMTAGPGTDKGLVAQHKRVVRMGFETSLDSPQGVGALAMARMVNALSGQRLEIQIFPDSELGTAVKLLDMVKTGELDLFQGGPGIFSAMEKRFNVFDIPYLFSSTAQACQVLDGEFGQQMLAAFDAHGLKGLAFWETGMRDITNNVRPIQQVADLAGLRMRIPVNNPVQADLWKRLGTVPIPLPFGRIYEALKAGDVDSQEHPVSLIYSAKLHEVQRYLTRSGHMYTPMIQVMNLRTFESLDERDREIMLQASRVGAAAQRKFAAENEAQYLVTMTSRGMQVNELSPHARAALRDAVRPAMQASYVRENGDAWLKAIQSAIGNP